jgi:uncharacterized SAM-dependent methyltransferase
MKYFKNTELAKIHNVSEKSVRNWVQACLDGKLDLQLYEVNGKFFVENTSANTQKIKDLAAKGKKYKNTRGYKVISPSEKFYRLYSPKQIVDIMSNLDIYKESPLQYTYFNSGAERWDQYTQNLLKQNSANSLTNTLQLLDNNLRYIDSLIQGYDSVNIIDVGAGNALPIRPILEHITAIKKLNRYIAIDISKELLDLAEHNVNDWFKGEIEFEGYIRDINYDRFDDLVVSESFGLTSSSTINLVFFLGGTISNFRQPNRAISTIHDSMGKNDLLIFSKKIDTEQSRRYFEMAVKGNQEIDLVLKLLNIEESMYTIEQSFDEKLMSRRVSVKLKIALAIKFELYGQEKIVEFNKGDEILLWRARHETTRQTIEQFDDNGFELLGACRSKDKDYLLLISQIRSSNHLEEV